MACGAVLRGADFLPHGLVPQGDLHPIDGVRCCQRNTAKSPGCTQLEHIQQWTELQSLDMKKQHYRRNYLNFDPQRMNLADMAQCVKVSFPILLQSTHISRVRQMLFKTLLRHFSR